MHTTKSLSMLIGLTLLVGLMTFPVVAAPQKQGSNLLQDPTFDLAVQGTWKWDKWSYTKQETDPAQSFTAPVFMPSEAKWDHGSGGQSGAAGSVAGQAGTMFRAGFYQTLAVQAGTRVRFSVWVNEFCQSGGSACPLILKAGIDPTGGTDWSSGNIKWAGTEISNDKYAQLVTDEVVVGDGGKVTVFTWGELRFAALYAAAYFDDAVLMGTAGSATSTASQAAQPTATVLQASQPIAVAQVQGSNLLQDPTFDLAAQGTWKWDKWSYAKKEAELGQSFVSPVFMPSEAKWDHGSGGQSGAAGSLAGEAGAKFRAGFYQTVAVQAGTSVRFSVWVNEFCQSGGSGCPVILKAGIDPTGGTDWSSGNIKWAGTEISNNKYAQLVTEAVTVGDGGKVTVFTWGELRFPAFYAAAYFDDAALIGTAGTAAPTTSQPGQPAATAQPAACAQVGWVSDVTIPDNTVMAPGTQFVKTWRVKNAGSCAFSGTLNFFGKGNQMGGQGQIALPKIEAGQQLDVSVNLTAPTQAGDYFGTWQPRTNDGAAMENLVVRIKVSAAAATAVPTATATPILAVTATPSLPTPQATQTPSASPTPAPGQACIQAFNDLNGDGQLGADESLLAGVVFSLSDASGLRDSYTTDSVSEPHCFADLPPGTYQMTIKPPANYASTTFDAMTINLSGGMKADVVYGAKRGGAALAPTPAAAASGGTAAGGGLLGNAGRVILIVFAALVLVALGGGIGVALMRRR